MKGIRRHRIGLVLVTHLSENYWSPPEDVCFQFLLQAYGEAFHLSHQGPNDQIFEVTVPMAGT
jgi:hypothetical protein